MKPFQKYILDTMADLKACASQMMEEGIVFEKEKGKE